jgi:hypothetical protein
MFVKPGPQKADPSLSLIVRGPNRALLPTAGAEVGETNFWHRRLRDGDVVSAEARELEGQEGRNP